MKEHFTIPSSIEKRLQVWTDWAERQGQQDTHSHPCITISREYGCQAYKLAEAIFERFREPEGDEGEWTMLDRYLLEKVAQDSGYSKSELNYLTHTNPNFQAAMANLSGPETASPSKAFATIRETIRYFARKGNAIIIGRGGAILTQDLENVLHIRLVASMDFKVRHIMKSMGLPAREAEALIQARQDERNAFIKHFTHMDSTDPQLYHMIINNDKSNIEEIAEAVAIRTRALVEE